MATISSDPVVHADTGTGTLETRPFGAAASETLAFGFGLIGALSLLLIAFLPSGQDPAVLLRFAGEAGSVLIGHVDWAMNIYVTTLLGFYAVVIGGQILGGGSAVRDTRRVLGAVAELMAAAAIILLACVSVYCFNEPQHWAVMIVLLPCVGIVFFLAAQLGRFLVAEKAVRLKMAADTRDGAQAKLDALPRGSVRSVSSVLVMNALTFAAVATLVTYSGLGVPGDFVEAAGIAVVYLLVASMFAGWNLYARHAARMADRIGRFAFLSITVGLYASLGAVTIQTWSTAFQASLGFLFIGLATAVSTLSPTPALNWWVFDWSLGGGALRLTRRSLAKIRARAATEYEDLKTGTQSPILLVPGWRRDHE